MTDIERAFSRGKAFIPFMTAGDPDIKTTKNLIKGLADEGADLIEVGIPFSDPTAEGPVIQSANMRGIASGTTTDDVFQAVKELREDGLDVPLAIMTYANVVFSYGMAKFMKKMKDSGFCALILPDVPYEEKTEFSVPASSEGISLISLIAPTSQDRIEKIASDASGFIYCVSSLGVTGMRDSISSDVGEIVRSVKAIRPDIPAAIGFGISNAQSAAAMAELSDGVIIGSAIVNIIAEHGSDSPRYVREFAKGIVSAIR